MDIIDAALNINKSHEEDILARLTTVWGEQLDAEHVLEEYPRPQMKREHYVILNGYWNYAITGSSEAPATYDGRILVPFSPESILSGVERQLQPEEYLWYERTLTITEAEYTSGQHLLLHFGAVDQTAEVSVNGQVVCTHTGGYLPFEADITAYLQKGENSLRLRVQDVSDTSYHSRGKQTLKRGGMFYTPQSGIWQTVWMEWVPKAHIQKLYITPDYDRQEITVKIVASDTPTVPANIHMEVYADEHCLYETEVMDENNTLYAPLYEVHPWTPETPFLYTLRIHYGDDFVESYFAMRTFTIESDEKGIPRFCLNHTPLMDTIDSLYNVPSIAVWVPFNEGWGQFDANRIFALIKEKDSTRPIDQTSGWFDQKGGDFKSIHNYFRKLKVIKDHRAFVLSEYGGYACHIDGHSSVERIYGYHKFNTPEAFTAAYRHLIEDELKPLIEEGLCGAVYTQLSDVEEEVNGLLTYDRKICKLTDTVLDITGYQP